MATKRKAVVLTATAIAQIEKAKQLGAQGFQKGLKAPCQCNELFAMFVGRKPGMHPEGEASTEQLLKTWLLECRRLMDIKINEDLKALGF